MTETIRVLVVDDSPTMRRLIRAGIETDPRVRVVAEAGTAQEAREAVKTYSPDVMTLDIDMPGMSGLEFLERLMRARPMPVIMISSLTARGSDAAVRALSLGAFDCVEKPRFGNAQATFIELAEKIEVASKSASPGVRTQRAPRAQPQAAPRPSWDWNGKWILLGSSTGGVEALERLLSDFPEDCPPTLITQHMPAPFLVSFAARLDGLVPPKVMIATDGAQPRRGEVYIAPGGETHMVLDRKGDTLRLVEGEKRSGHRPSVDALFDSAVDHGGKIIAGILTGMGRDGAEGMLHLHRAGAVCIGQDRGSCVVYGMPRVAMELGAIDAELPLDHIPSRLIREASL